MSKRIVISADGTWNKPDQKDNGVICPTNIVWPGHNKDKGEIELTASAVLVSANKSETCEKINSNVCSVSIFKSELPV